MIYGGHGFLDLGFDSGGGPARPPRDQLGRHACRPAISPGPGALRRARVGDAGSLAGRAASSARRCCWRCAHGSAMLPGPGELRRALVSDVADPAGQLYRWPAGAAGQAVAKLAAASTATPGRQPVVPPGRRAAPLPPWRRSSSTTKATVPSVGGRRSGQGQRSSRPRVPATTTIHGSLILKRSSSAEGGQRDGRGRQVGDGLAGQDDDGTGQGAAGGGGGAGDECLDLRVVAVAEEPAAGQHDAEPDRGEDRDGGDDRAGKSGDEVADEGGGDHDRARG